MRENPDWDLVMINFKLTQVDIVQYFMEAATSSTGHLKFSMRTDALNVPGKLPVSEQL